MNAQGGNIAKSQLRRIEGKAPVMLCAICGTHATTRTSEEITATTRKLYYRCPNVLCGRSWTALLTVENVINPSALGEVQRRTVTRTDKPPGHDFGQMTIFEVLRPRTATG